MKTETKVNLLRMEAKAETSDAGDMIVEGYGSAFDVLDSHHDVVTKGAFARSIKDRHSQNLIKFCNQHGPSIGRITELEEDDFGLKFKAVLANIPEAQELHEKIRVGAVDRFSIGYSKAEGRKGKPAELGLKLDVDHEVRMIEGLTLYEISAVDFASNEQAHLIAVKSADGAWELKGEPAPAPEPSQEHEAAPEEQKADPDMDAIKAATTKIADGLQELIGAIGEADPVPPPEEDEEDGKGQPASDLLTRKEDLATLKALKELFNPLHVENNK